MPRVLAFLLLALALPVSAQIYKYTDANGNAVFTNQPPSGVQSEEVKIQQPNTVKVAPSKPLDSDSGSTDEQTQDAYERLELTNIPDDEALRANNGTFSVEVAIEPKLMDNHSLRLLLDGEPYGKPTTSTSLELVNIDRGEHSLAVEVLNANGESLQQSAATTITVQRVNVNTSPALRPKPTPVPTPKATP
ncbi:DUF4124 domain-containing protein [Pseudomonas mangrovi]|jgi:hypothetical protein|uniref:DUF4124 domain-containing protein n=1 Tax=Pseudomonas mangrovi TaxID=2161748 RepID=A0A2T5P907_9PSED|nr:DUF4124 domain-containing protein [Pseudomonas mangrovi]PTU74234.1 DUF4124 domain-containing protein [Pseudomonas mangrovi]